MWNIFKKRRDTEIKESSNDAPSCIHISGETSYPQYVIGVMDRCAEILPLICFDGVPFEYVKDYLNNLCNPLYNSSTFTQYYLKIIDEGQSFDDVAWINVSNDVSFYHLSDNATMEDIISTINNIIDKLASL